MHPTLLFLTIHLSISHSIRTLIHRAIPYTEPKGCSDVIDECLLRSPYVIRQFANQSVMSWDTGRALCMDPDDDEVDGMATLDVSPKAIADTPLDAQFDLLREICARLMNNDGKNVNCWVGGKLNRNGTHYAFHRADTNHRDYTVQNNDHSRWGCVRNNDGSCKKDIEGNLNNGEDYITLFHNRDYFFADWPRNGGTNADFEVTAVVCNSKHFSYIDRCQCFCDSCHIYGDPHIRTFDGLMYHLKGKCVYQTVTPCAMKLDSANGGYKPDFNEDFPIEISTENGECLDGLSSCLTAVYVSLYDTLGGLQTVIKFGHSLSQMSIVTTVEFINEGELQLQGLVDLDVSQTWVLVPPYEYEPWSFLLTKSEDYYTLGIWTHTKYQTARLEFRDLNGLHTHLAQFADVKVTLSSCFAGNTCGICGYYDEDDSNEFKVRDTDSDQLVTLDTNAEISDPFHTQSMEIISQFSELWTDEPRSMPLEYCEMVEYSVELCKIDYCDDECVCDASVPSVSTYNGIKQNQCNYDLAACLGWSQGSKKCRDWQDYSAQQREDYLSDYYPHCGQLTTQYCCLSAFCEDIPDMCTADTPAPTDNPVTSPPSAGPTREPTDKPSLLPTLAPTAGPTEYPTPEQTTTTDIPTQSPISPNYCTPLQASHIDIVFLVDNSCGLPEDECRNQQYGISEYLASIKGSSDPRIAYLTFGDSHNTQTIIHLKDRDYNDLSNDHKGVINRIKYVSEIRDYDCGPVMGYANTDLILGIDAAMNELRFGVSSDTMDRDRKIVIFSNCEHNSDSYNPCDLLGNDLMIESKRVEITVVNIVGKDSEQPNFKNNAHKYLQCLSGDEPDRFIVLQNTKPDTFSRNSKDFVGAVCENDTPQPTPNPSTHVPSLFPSENPSENPSDHPSLTPLEHPCEFSYDADVIFVVDASCGLSEEQCSTQQHFISDIVQTIKTSNQPRLSYIDCDSGFIGDTDNLLLIRLSDTVFNHNNKLPNDEQLRALYFDMIHDSTKCNANGNTVPRKECINIALEEFKSYSKQGKHKKLVIYSACESSENVCDLRGIISDENIEVVLINIGVGTNNENECLLRDFETGLVYELPEIDNWEPTIVTNVKSQVTNAICKEPTQKPTVFPILEPTARTRTPTVIPILKPTARPFERSRSPTHSPLEDTCDFEGDADILFVVDVSCGLDEQTCDTKRTFISDLVQSIKKSHNPRIGLLECGTSSETQYSIKLSDLSFNNINDNTQLSKAERDLLYFTKIETRLQCLPGSSVPKLTCLRTAVDIFNSESSYDRIRKIIYFQICPNSNRQSACSQRQQIFNANIEIILVNIGNQVRNGYHDCLFWNGEPNLYTFEDWDFDTIEAREIKQGLVTHMCSINHLSKPLSATTTSTTAVPTNKPTNKPTAKPTNKPTPKPTNKPTPKPTNKPTKKPTKGCVPTKRSNKWGYESDESSDPCSDESSDDNKPTKKPKNKWPTKKPTWPTKKPTKKPSKKPTKKWPSKKPSKKPTKKKWPSKKPTKKPKKKWDKSSESQNKNDKNFKWDFEESSDSSDSSS